MNIQQYKILLIGDDCLDVYQYGTVDRISPEAPVPVFKMGEKEERPGMARNVKANLEELNCKVSYLSGRTSVKTRLLEKRSRQQICRIDNDLMSSPLRISEILWDVSMFEAIVISDYAKGYVSYECIEELRESYGGPMFLDTKKQDLARFQGIHIKINELEYNNRKSINDSLIVTLGSKGAMYQKDGHTTIYQTSEVEVSDVCGAGDTFLAALVYQYLKSQDMDQAIHFANLAASITVQRMGNYAPTLDELL
jgi:D-beta-D-heptose 7-phosphate kinase/D-beta-D-heptose 1-phosphate adenosyltransferase